MTTSSDNDQPLEVQPKQEYTQEIHTEDEQARHESQSSKEKESRLATIVFENLSPDYPKINAFSHFIGWAIIFVILLALNLLIDKVNLPIFILPIIGTLSILSAFHGYYSAKACGYFIGEFDILYKEGLWWKKQTALSFSRIQHIDISHGPLERKYQIATIKFFTAGGMASDLKISGLLNHVAESLRAEILRVTKNKFDSEQELSQIDNQDEKIVSQDIITETNEKNVSVGIQND